jgi:anti-sigma factor RsiW
MNCQSYDARLDALLDGRCSQAEWDEAETHLAACARCRQVFEAMSGRGGDLDDAGHEALATAVVAKTSGAGRACDSARDRICAYVDGDLDSLDRDLVEGHLQHCAACAALAAAVAEQTAVLRTLAALPPRTTFAGQVIGATSRRPLEPSLGERIGAWLSRAAQRPRFAVEAAYVMTVLLLIVFGNPVAAFREATVRVQPRVTAVAGVVGRPLHEMRAAGAEKLARVEQALAPKGAASPAGGLKDVVMARAARWVQGILEPLEWLAARVGAWAAQAYVDVRTVFAGSKTEPGARPAR